MANYRVLAIGHAPRDHKSEGLRGGSFFGDDPDLAVVLPPGRTLPAQLLLTLDNHDLRIAGLDIGVGARVRLVHPFHHSEGETAVYRHLDENAVEFTLLPGAGSASWPHARFPDAFPSREIEIVEAGPDPVRAFGDASTMFLGAGSPTVQVYDRIVCGHCSTPQPRLIASIPSRPLPGLDIWRNDSVYVLFWFCPACRHISTHNEAD